ncbi:deoxyribodipyrimidine photo-lyase [Rubrobacter aplysinae]|uniref:deoxyribodipyrimidine photo-lyase n=1 Tax=Rubrobacter aplysinae TaxID=909625 RepID=UPI00064BE0AC|nr:deoxyribodipyrimidine photo-lyase [Rubrobacter aplysinae]
MSTTRGTAEIQSERIQPLNGEDTVGGDYVLYWMQAAVRARHNHALEYAVQRANSLDQRLLVAFGLTDDYPEANLRHFAFLVDGLRDVRDGLKERGLKLVVRRGAPDAVALDLAADASLVVCDRGYLRHQRAWREKVANEAGREVVQVESEVVVPVELASDKKETAARTLRPKIQRHRDDFLIGLDPTIPDKQSLNMSVSGEDLDRPEELLGSLDVDRGVEPLGHLFRGGHTAARRALDAFLESNISTYSGNRNQPQTDDVSHMSKYLHYGHISPIEVALTVLGSGGPQEDKDSFIEELTVRRELAMNFVFYEPDYDSFSCLPGWAQDTLRKHAQDSREYVYTTEQLENGETHDEYWNAAMMEMVHTGYMHNYMRMYWGKKILEWTEDPQDAYQRTLYLNNKYFIDGRDANSYANVSWVFGQHDQGWKERPVFGKVRYMAANGLERKTKPKQYVQKIEERTGETLHG